MLKDLDTPDQFLQITLVRKSEGGGGEIPPAACSRVRRQVHEHAQTSAQSCQLQANCCLIFQEAMPDPLSDRAEFVVSSVFEPPSLLHWGERGCCTNQQASTGVCEGTWEL